MNPMNKIAQEIKTDPIKKLVIPSFILLLGFFSTCLVDKNYSNRTVI